MADITTAATLSAITSAKDGYDSARDASLYNRLCDAFGTRNICQHPSPDWGWIVCGKSLSMTDCELLLAEKEKAK